MAVRATVTDGVGRRSVESPLAPRAGAHFSGIVAAIKFAWPPSQSLSPLPWPTVTPPARDRSRFGVRVRGRDRVFIVGRTVRLASLDLLDRWPRRASRFRVEIPLTLF